MPSQRLTYEDVRGVYSIMPTPAVEDATDPETTYSLNLEESRRGAKALARDGVDAIMINGTFGEGATLTDEEWRMFTQAVVDAVDGEVPVLAGPTTLNTRKTIDRAEFARDVGADGLLLGRPMWCKLSAEATLEFYRDVAESVPELGIVLYYNPTAFKNEFDLDLWERLAEIPQIVGTKYITLDEDYPKIFERVKGKMRVMTLEHKWVEAYQQLPEHATAFWCGSASCDPAPAVALREAVFSGDMDAAEEITDRLAEANWPMIPEGDMRTFRTYNIPLQKARMSEAGYIAAGPARPPYHVVPEAYEEGAREAGRRWKKLAGEIENGEVP
ncbi:dihydrodipicolinate synthase family protein [Halobellus sp. GM3]|uniref:dihydrodipicolinate synthase family protein n=1 Tax=Halobellus sp. GM3 TaxID=3458410 RepID=UPI00403E26C3